MTGNDNQARCKVLPDCRVPMRDGVHLATDVYLPAAQQGPFTVLLERTPYDKRGTNHGDRTLVAPAPVSKPEIAAQFVAAGYVYVLQDCRGRYGSEGTFTKYLSEGEDGEDTLAWILQQPWCNGRVGTLGLSYCAHVQAALACGNPPGLGAMFLDCGGFSNSYQGGVRQGGAYELKQLTWALKQALADAQRRGDAALADALQAQDIREWMTVRWRKGHSPVAGAPEYENYILEQWDADTFGPYWQQRGIHAAGFYDQFSDVPQVHLSGWYDPYSQTAIDNFTALAARKRSPVRLVLGPWTHGQRSVTHAGDVDFGPAASLDGNLATDFVSLRRDWFDRHLRGMHTVADPLPDPVTLFVMGGGDGRRNAAGRLNHGGRWRHSGSWPPPEVESSTVYLRADGAIVEQPPASGSHSRTYRADPRNPVPTIGGAITSGEPLMFAGAYDQRERADMFGSTAPGRALADRDDVLVFRTEPLAHDVELTGNVVAELFISCTTPDADVVIRLIDEYPPSADFPDGFALNLAHGILRLRFRESFERAVPMVPGVIYPVRLQAFPTSNLCQAGHRIRVDIAGSSFPHFDVNPNADWASAEASPQVTAVTLHCSQDFPSRVVLPVVRVRS
jgi:putative CocE/NonD family hydrolase